MEILIGLVQFFVATLVALVGLMVVSPLFKGKLTSGPNSTGIDLFTIVEPERSKVKMRGGYPVEVLRGEDGAPKPPDSIFLYPWWVYRQYVYWLIGAHVIVPFIQNIYTYDLPRYRVREENGKKVFKAVPEDEPGYRTDHIRTSFTTWYFEFKGAEVNTVPMTVQGSVQIHIQKGNEYGALFKTDAWNVLLTQALTSVIRGLIRAEATLDDIIGSVPKNLWDNDAGGQSEVYGEVQRRILEELQQYKVGGKTLEGAIGLIIDRVDIIDFAPEIGAEELMAPAVARQNARARSIQGDGEAEYQEKSLAVMDRHPDTAHKALEADALVKMAGNGQINAILSALIKKFATS